MAASLFLVYAAAHLLIFGGAVAVYSRTRWISSSVLMLLTAALFYDDLILGIGSAFDSVATLEALSWPRFVLHAIITPLVVVAVVDIATRSRLAWAQRRNMLPIAWLGSLALIVLAVVVDLRTLELEAHEALGVVRMRAVDPLPPIATILTMVVALVVGISLWRRVSWRWLALGSAAMFAAAGAPPIEELMIIGNAGEVVLMASLYATVRWAEARAIEARSTVAAVISASP